MSKQFIEALKSSRIMWNISPITRVHDKNKKSKKKNRKKSKEEVVEYLKNEIEN